MKKADRAITLLLMALSTAVMLSSNALAAATNPSAASAAQEKNSPLRWSLTPYLWATETTYNLKSDGNEIGTGDIDFGDLYDTLDASFQIIAEMGLPNQRWSAFVDVTYLETSDDESFPVQDIGNLTIDSSSEQLYLDAAIAFWPWGEAGGFNIFGGIRYTDLDDESKVDLIEPIAERLGVIRTDRDFTDALFGGRYRFDLNENWSLHTRADYGFGDSEGVFLAEAAFRRVICSKRRNGLMFGYRYKEAEFKSGSLKETYDYKGLIVGFNFRF